MIRLTLLAHHALGQPITERVDLPCSSHSQVAAALADLFARARALVGVGTIRWVEIRRERIAA